MKPLRVVHITPSVRLLGARRSLLTLVQELAGTRVESLVVVPSQGALTEEFDRLGIPYRVVYLPPWRKAKSWLKMVQQVRQLRQVIKEWDADVVHCNEIYPNPHALAATAGGGVAGELLSRFLQRKPLRPQQIPVVTHMRLSVNDRLIWNYYLEDATRLIAVSNGAAADFDGYTWKASRVRVVYNGINFEPFAAARTERNAVRSEVGFAESDFIIGQIGLMMPRKRPRFLLECAAEILKQVPNAKFLFVGDASPGQAGYLDELKAIVSQNGFSEAVRFLPFQKNVARYFAVLDLNMLVSDEEGFGRVILEAAAAGVPTVGSRVGGIPELIEHEQTGYLLGPEGSDGSKDEVFWQGKEQFIKIVAELASDAGKLKTMGEAAAKRAAEKFGVEQYVSGCVQVFHEAVEEFDRQRDQW